MAHLRTRRGVPRLDQRVLSDPDALGVALNALFDSDPRMKQHRRKIIALQNWMRNLVTDEAWSAYLDLETASAGRLNDAIDLVAAWAFRQGRRSPLPR